MLTPMNLRNAKKFCKDSIDEIEGWFRAETQSGRFDLHHKLEEQGYSKQELIAKGLYYGRPADELVFLTQEEHSSLHHKGEKNSFYGKPAWNKDKQLSEEHRRKLSEAKKGKQLSGEHRRKLSEAKKGEKHPLYNKHHSEETRKMISEAQPNKINICPTLLQKMRYEQHLTYKQIADQLGVAYSTIRKKLLLLNKETYKP